MSADTQLELTLVKSHNLSKCTCCERVIGEIIVGFDEGTKRFQHKDEIGIFRKRVSCPTCASNGCERCEHKGFLKICFCGNRVEPVSKDEMLNRLESQCAVATAVLDTQLDPALDAMRKYRDGLVKSGGFGAWASNYYDSVKAPVAVLVRRNRWMRMLFLVIVVPIVFLQQRKQSMLTSTLVFFLGMLGVALTGLVHAVIAPAKQRT